MITTTRTHAPIVESYARTETTPAEITVTCTCGQFLFESQESITGGIEAWQDAWYEHLEEEEDQ